jgi:hypothetical protein
MNGPDRLCADLGAAIRGAGSASGAADRLCLACVDLLAVDGAAISLTHEGSTRGTFGSSGELSRRLDELQFTFDEGPCLDAVHHGSPVLVSNLSDVAEQRWPSFRGALLGAGVKAVFALPVRIASDRVGALDLFRREPGSLAAESMTGGLLAAQLAAVPLLDLMTATDDSDDVGQGDDGWEQLASLERTEVYQATGMIIGALDVGPTEALVRLRAYALSHGMTASEVAWGIVERRLALDSDDWRPGPDQPVRPTS